MNGCHYTLKDYKDDSDFIKLVGVEVHTET